MSLVLYKKRKRSPAAQALMVARPLKRPRRAFVRGRDRQVGYYGRYAGRDGELKFHTVSYDDAVVATAGTLEQTGTINAIGQGITERLRVGRKCTIRAIKWRYSVTLPIQDAVGAPVTGDTVRMMLFIDKQCNGATATVSGADGLLETANIHSHRELTNTGRFNVLMDKLVNIGYTGLAADAANSWGQGAVIKNYSYLKSCNVPLEFNGTTGVIAEIRSNNIGVMLISQNGIAGFLSQFRLRFSDGGA